MPGSISIRRFQVSDLARVAELEARCNSLPWHAHDLADFAVDSPQHNPQRMAWVAVPAGSEIASGYLFVGLAGDEAEILIFGVDPESRRLGIGAKLLSNLLDQKNVLNFEKVFLEVRRRNAAALAVYRIAGFLEVGIRKAYYADTGEDAVLMRWTAR